MTKFKQDENNNQEPADSDSESDILTLYVRAGCDNRKYGACPFCQRIFMLLMLKSAQGGKKIFENLSQIHEGILIVRLIFCLCTLEPFVAIEILVLALFVNKFLCYLCSNQLRLVRKIVKNYHNMKEF